MDGVRIKLKSYINESEFWFFGSAFGTKSWRPWNPPYKIYGPLIDGYFGITEQKDCGNVLIKKTKGHYITGLTDKKTATEIVERWNHGRT